MKIHIKCNFLFKMAVYGFAFTFHFPSEWGDSNLFFQEFHASLLTYAEQNNNNFANFSWERNHIAAFMVVNYIGAQLWMRRYSIEDDRRHVFDDYNPPLHQPIENFINENFIDEHQNNNNANGINNAIDNVNANDINNANGMNNANDVVNGNDINNANGVNIFHDHELGIDEIILTMMKGEE